MAISAGVRFISATLVLLALVASSFCYSDFDNHVEINCTINMSVVEYLDESQSWLQKGRLAPTHQSLILHNTSLQIVMSAVTMTGTPYTCRVDNHTHEADGHIHLHPPAEIRLDGYAPLLFDNFSCVSPNFENMTCSWDTTATSESPSVELFYSFGFRCSSHSHWRSCPHVDAQSCTWQHSFSRFNHYCFMMMASGELGDEIQWFIIDPYRIVKPNKVQNIVLESDKTTMTISWDSPVGLSIDLVYDVSYQTEWDDPETWKNISTEDKSTVLSELIPYTVFTVRIRCRVLGYGGYWSDHAPAMSRTHPDVPGAAPSLSPGSYWAGALHGDIYDVRLYWKPVPRMLRHGVIRITRIIIREMTSIGDLRTDVTASEQSNDTYDRHGTVTSSIGGNAIDTRIHNLNISMSYEISIDVATLQGYSLKPAIVFVPRQLKDRHCWISYAVVAVRLNFTHYRVGWSRNECPRVRRPDSVAVHWCQGTLHRTEGVSADCQADYDWVSVSPNITEIVVAPSLSSRQKTYVFAVSFVTMGVSLGMTWVPYVFHIEKDLKLCKPVIRPLSSQHRGEVIVEWSLPCTKVPPPMLYQIIYEKSKTDLQDYNCTGTVLNITAVHIYGEVRIRNLTSLTRYSVCMRIVSENGVGSIYSSAIVTTVSAGHLESPIHAIITKTNVSTVEISWELPVSSTGETDYYVIYYQSNSEDEKRIKSDCCNVSINGLRGFTRYQISIAACNTVMCSSRTPSINYTTNIREPSEVDFKLLFLQATSQVKVSWKNPKQPNGPIDHYVIYYAWTNQNHHKNKTSIIRSNRRFIVIAISCIPSSVSFQVWAVNTFEGSTYIGAVGSPKEVHVCSDIDADVKAAIGASTTMGVLALLVAIIWYLRCRRYFKKDIPIDVPILMENRPIGVEYAPYSEDADAKESSFMLEHISHAKEPRTYSRMTSANASDASSLDEVHDVSGLQTSQRNIGGNHANEYCDITLSTFKQTGDIVAVNENNQNKIPANNYQGNTPSNGYKENTMKFPENISTNVRTNENYIDIDNEQEESIWILQNDEAPVYLPLNIRDMYFDSNNQVNMGNDVTEDNADLASHTYSKYAEK